MKDSTMQNIVHENAYLLYKWQKSGFGRYLQKQQTLSNLSSYGLYSHETPQLYSLLLKFITS